MMRDSDLVYRLENTAAALWRKACEYDEIEPTEKFVVFSSDNRPARLYNLAVGKLMQERREGRQWNLTASI